MSELIYKQNGDYFLPDLGLTEAEQKPLGKYGRMRLQYLEQDRPGLYTRLILSGKLMEHLQEIEETANARLEQMMNSPMRPPEMMKMTDQMGWVARMNSLKAQAEEMICSELIYA